MQDYEELKNEVLRLQEAGHRQPYLLYAMALRLGTMDIHGLETDALLDGKDDKKVDFFHLDLEDGVAIVAQGYCATDWSKLEAPSNKASDLATAMNWLLDSEIEAIPRLDIRAAATELRDALNTGLISRLEVLFVHNLPSSSAIDRELDTIERALIGKLERFGSNSTSFVDPRCTQVSRETVQDWIITQNQSITVRDKVSFESNSLPVQLEEPDWETVLIAVPAGQIVTLRKAYGDKLSSANIRDYLGSRQSARNINKQIVKTAVTEPQNFLIFNNGITILTNKIETDGRKVTLTGISIINGAQTTGGLEEASKESGSVRQASVLVRIVRCVNPTLVERVIRFNNTQNPIKAWELRVIDPIQQRIADAFSAIGVNYQTRRGLVRRRSSDVHYEKLGPYLAAFNGDPGGAHRNRAELFENEAKYRQLFDDETEVSNLLFIYRLGEAVQDVKSGLKVKVEEDLATPDEIEIYNYFRYGAFSLVVLYVCAEVIGIWLGGRDLRYRRKVTLVQDVLEDQARTTATLKQIVDIALKPMHQHFQSDERGAYNIIRSQAATVELATKAKTMVSMVESMQPDVYAAIRESFTIA
jgi:hypothetical protein